MQNVIVTTTISPPSSALLKYTRAKVGFYQPGETNPKWHIIVAGDKRTPHNEYTNLEGITYLHPDQQHEMFPELSDTIGWNCIQRRYAAVLYAYKKNAEIFAFADDDNIPYSNWGDDADLLNNEVEAELYRDEVNNMFDPYSATNHPELWHRGYPLDLVRKRKPLYCGHRNIKPLVIERLVDGDPDIDAIYRLPFRPTVKFKEQLFTSYQPTVFNSQNTLVAREVIPYYLNLPGVGRHDDIIGSILFQRLFPNKDSLPYIAFSSSTVYQERYPQDLVRNLEMEIFGYRHTLDIASKPINELSRILPPQAVKAYKLWNEFFNVKTEL